MRFNDDADLDTSRIDYLGYRPIVPNPTEGSLTMSIDVHNAVYDILSMALTGVIVFMVLVTVAMVIDRRSARITRR